MTFHEAFDRIKSDLANTEIRVLVWGPGKLNPSGYAKREQIRNRIRSEFPRSSVEFSEDLKDPTDKAFPAASEVLSLEELETYHLAAADLAIVLDASAGSSNEIAFFSASRWASKLYVLTPEKHKSCGGFPSAIRDRLRQNFYSEDEFSTCKVVEKAVAYTRHIAFTMRMSGHR